jgi:hypothetical protein
LSAYLLPAEWDSLLAKHADIGRVEKGGEEQILEITVTTTQRNLYSLILFCAKRVDKICNNSISVSSIPKYSANDRKLNAIRRIHIQNNANISSLRPIGIPNSTHENIGRQDTSYLFVHTFASAMHS